MVLGLMGSGCSREVTLVLEPSGATRLWPNLPKKLEVDGREIPAQELGTTLQIPYSAPPKFLVRATTDGITFPSVTLRVLLPCGWKVVRAGGWTDVVTDAWNRFEFQWSDEWAIASPVDVYVDNRLRDAASLTLGKLPPMSIAARATSHVRLPRPECEAGSVLQLEGSQVGTIPSVDPKTLGDRRNDLYYFLDTTGNTCFELDYHYYGSAPYKRKPLRRLSGQYLYDLLGQPRFDSAPERMMVSSLAPVNMVEVISRCNRP